MCDIDESRVEDSLKIELLIEILSNAYNLIIVLRSSTDDHLCTLPCRNELRGMAVEGDFVLILCDPILYHTHGS